LYLDHWGLAKKPFENTPDSSFFYESNMHMQALSKVRYALLEQKGCVLLTGDYGCGKTALVRKVIEALDPASFEVGLSHFPLFTADEFKARPKAVG